MSDEMRWWGPLAMRGEESGRLKVGPSTLWFRHGHGEWGVSHHRGDDLNDDVWSWDVPGDAPPEGVPSFRFVYGTRSQGLVVAPATADRPLVARPEVPLRVLPDQEVVLYINTPLWVMVKEIAVESALLDVPVWRPSDTWFGADTMEGELCYAMRTHARLELGEVPRRPHRALCVVQFHNKGQDTMALERIKLPMKAFSLYSDDRGLLWTEVVHAEHRDRRGQPEASLGKPPRDIAGELEKVSISRDEASGSPLSRVLNLLVR